MKATGNFAACQHVDPMVALTDATRAHIDHWVAKFPPERKRSAVIQGLMAVQEQNGGWLTDELMAAATKLVDLYATVLHDQWQRPGLRSDGSAFTVDSFGRYVLHDIVHHLVDVRQGYELLHRTP